MSSSPNLVGEVARAVVVNVVAANAVVANVVEPVAKFPAAFQSEVRNAVLPVEQ